MLRPKLNLTIHEPGSGRTRPGALVTVYHANTITLATLYADDDVTVLANPIQADGLGEVTFRVAAGPYDISASWNGSQPKVTQDVIALIPYPTVIVSQGDLIVGDADGNPTRLAVGVYGKILISQGGMPTWDMLGAGRGLPTGSPGTMLIYSSTGELQSLAPGPQDQVLTMFGGVPTWAVPAGGTGTPLPINQPGDLVVGLTGGLPGRFPAGATNSLLRVASTGLLEWAPPGSLSYHRTLSSQRGYRPNPPADETPVETTLYSYVLPSGTMTMDGQRLLLRSWGHYTSAPGNKWARMRLTLGGAPATSFLLIDDYRTGGESGPALEWRLEVELLRNTSTEFYWSGTNYRNSLLSGYAPIDWAIAHTLSVTGQAGTEGEVAALAFSVDMLP
jgi:hypothetical protein